MNYFIILSAVFLSISAHSKQDASKGKEYKWKNKEYSKADVFKLLSNREFIASKNTDLIYKEGKKILDSLSYEEVMEILNDMTHVYKSNDVAYIYKHLLLIFLNVLTATYFTTDCMSHSKFSADQEINMIMTHIIPDFPWRFSLYCGIPYEIYDMIKKYESVITSTLKDNKLIIKIDFSSKKYVSLERLNKKLDTKGISKEWMDEKTDELSHQTVNVIMLIRHLEKIEASTLVTKKFYEKHWQRKELYSKIFFNLMMMSVKNIKDDDYKIIQNYGYECANSEHGYEYGKRMLHYLISAAPKDQMTGNVNIIKKMLRFLISLVRKDPMTHNMKIIYEFGCMLRFNHLIKYYQKDGCLYIEFDKSSNLLELK